MAVAEPSRKRAPFIQPMFSAFAYWWRKQHDIRKSLNSLDMIDERQVTQMASDLSLAPADLRGAVRCGPDAAKLLYARMHVLHLDPASLASKNWGVMRDLQRLCSLCRSKRLCQRQLAQHPVNPAWREYCLNEQTLVALMNERVVKH